MTIVLCLRDGRKIRAESLDDLNGETPGSLGITDRQYSLLTEILSEPVS